MDLIYTNANKEDQGVLFDYEFDLAFGADENNFECTIQAEKHCMEAGSFLYIEGTEYGGIVDSIKVDTEHKTVTYIGRTWHGILEGYVIEPESGYDYHVVKGEGNAVLAGLIEYLGLSDIFTASAEESGIDIAEYSFRYVDAYSGICKMLAEFSGKLKLKHDVDKVILYTVPLNDYSQDEEFDSSQVDFNVKKNFRPTNHLVCLGSGNLKERHVIHLFTDENGGIQPYKTKDIPIEDADYILDKSKKLLFGLDEVSEILNYPNAQTKENFVKLSEQPTDWAVNYGNYFNQDENGGYQAFEGIPSEEITEITEQPDDWSTNYASYFYYVRGELKSVEAYTTEYYAELKKKPVDWETNYGNYYVYWSDGVNEGYNSISGVSKTRYVVQTQKPTDWKDNYSKYYTRYYVSDNGTKMLPVQGVPGSTPFTSSLVFAPTWKPGKYYTAETYQVAPEWDIKKTYYTKCKLKIIPSFVSGKYYTRQNTVLPPSFLPDVTFKKVLDHFADLVENGVERLKKSLNCDSVDIGLDLEGEYDIGDIVGASEHITGISVWQPITKKIVTIKNGRTTISYKVGD